MMPVILLAGIYGGATTPTEAAAVAAFYALLVAAFLYRSLTPRSLYDVFSTAPALRPPLGSSSAPP